MRFVRAYTRSDTGELVAVGESEVPIEGMAVTHMVAHADRSRVDMRVHDLGVTEEFEATELDGSPCSPSRHLFIRHESDGTGGVRAIAEHAHHLPAFHPIPVTKASILAAVRTKGPAAIPERVAHWLEYMEVLSDDEMEAHGLPRLTSEAADEFDAVRTRRDPTQRPRAHVHKMRMQLREELKAAKAAAVAKG